MGKQRLGFLSDFVEAITRRKRGGEAETLKALARLLAVGDAAVPGPVPDELTGVAGLLRRTPDGWALATVPQAVAP